MQAMLIHRYGGPEVFKRGEIATPRPQQGQVLVRVFASSVNPIDAALRSGLLKLFIRLRLPAVLGVDVAGEVVELGAGATRFRKGDRVFGFTGVTVGGGYGEFVAVADSHLARIPDKLDWAAAGTVPGSGTTAYEAFTIHSKVQAGMRVFVNGGSGGVGTYAVQIAKALGAQVSATCSGAKAALLQSLGADTLIDYTKGDPFAAGHDSYDVVLNTVRGASSVALRQLLKKGGIHIDVAGSPLDSAMAKLRSLVSSKRSITFLVQTSGQLLSGLAQMIESGSVRPIVERTYSWEELGEAHRRIESGRVAGKIAVLTPEISTK